MRKWIAFAVLVAVTVATGGTAAASPAPVVITYEKTCDTPVHCAGTTGGGGSFEMWVSAPSYRATGNAQHFTATESVTEGDISFTAELTATFSPAGFVVLDGIVTDGSFAGAKIHQRSNLDDPGPPDTWTGQLRIMPASA